jgi:asparagine synthase (glutamine-hydrolysing)
MCNEDEALWLVHNGEIYNYRELRPELLRNGHRFRSEGDSECILHAYEESGERCVERFNGMWAFALWDGRQRRLLLSRDRLGEKPLYYHLDARGLIFASEIKAILAIRPDLAAMSEQALSDFLCAGTLETVGETLFKGIEQVPPAHNFIVTLSGEHRLERYWTPPPPESASDLSWPQAVLRFRELLEDSIRLRLRSDVPVGTCLSGGLDSSSVVALETNLLRPTPVHTFSSVFLVEGFREDEFIDEVNRQFATVPHRVNPDPDFFSLLPRMIWHQEVPFPGPGVYPQWSVMALAARDVKVLLDGQGADELLGGYFYFYPYYVADLMREAWNPAALAEAAGAVFRISDRIGWRRTAGVAREALWRVADANSEAGYQGAWAAEFVSPDLAAKATFSLPDRPASRASRLNAILFEEVTRTSLPRLLHFEDRNSMAHSVESRTPFLDHRLVEFCLQLPPRMRIRGGETKAILREAMRGELPPAVVERKDKKGFPEPLVHWMRGAAFQAVADLLSEKRTRERGLLRPERIEAALQEHRAGENRTSPLYRALTAEIWARLFLDREGVGESMPAWALGKSEMARPSAAAPAPS